MLELPDLGGREERWERMGASDPGKEATNTEQPDQKHADYVSTAGLKLGKIVFLAL